MITASSRDLGREVERGRFRPDLFYRLDYHRIDLPPLRERREDIPGLAQLFLRDACARGPRALLGFTREAIEYLREQPWRGNVRELRSAVIDAASRASHTITVRDVLEAVSRRERRTESGAAHETTLEAMAPEKTPPETGAGPKGEAIPRVADGFVDPAAPDQAAAERLFAQGSYLLLTRRYFEYLRRRTGGNIPEMAKLAGVAKSTMYEWKRRFEPEED
jgi:DNA-binding NtrC family response regulator